MNIDSTNSEFPDIVDLSNAVEVPNAAEKSRKRKIRSSDIKPTTESEKLKSEAEDAAEGLLDSFKKRYFRESFLKRKQKIIEEVHRFLHPYLAGEIVSQEIYDKLPENYKEIVVVEDRNREPLVDVIIRNLEEQGILDIDKEEVEKEALNAYLERADLFFRYRMGVGEEVEKDLFKAVQAALKVDFPNLDMSEEELKSLLKVVHDRVLWAILGGGNDLHDLMEMKVSELVGRKLRNLKSQELKSLYHEKFEFMGVDKSISQQIYFDNVKEKFKSDLPWEWKLLQIEEGDFFADEKGNFYTFNQMASLERLEYSPPAGLPVLTPELESKLRAKFAESIMIGITKII